MSLDQHLTESQRFSPFYPKGGKLYTHLPMALCALQGMGASESRLGEFARISSTKLVLKNAQGFSESLEPLVIKNWRKHLGEAAYYERYEALFSAWIKEQGVQAVLSETLGVLCSGVASAAFHPFIRLAYALETGYVAEIAATLASWAACYEPLMVAKARNDMDDMDEKIAALSLREQSLAGLMNAARTALQLCIGGMSDHYIIERLKAVSGLVGFSELSQAALFTQPNLADIAQASLVIYLDSYNFTALHMLTATHAARVVLQHLPELEAALLPHLLHAWLAAWVTIDCPLVDLTRLGAKEYVVAPQDWAALLAKVSLSNDEHRIKLAFSLWQEGGHYQHSAYLETAKGLAAATH